MTTTHHTPPPPRSPQGRPPQAHSTPGRHSPDDQAAQAAHNARIAALYDELLMNYARGALDHMMALMMASHVTLSPQARRTVHMYESIGGVLIEENCSPAAMTAGSLQSVLARLDCADAAAACNPHKDKAAAPENMALPQPLCRFLSAMPTQAHKWRALSPGVAIMALPCAGEGAIKRAWLLRARPGAAIPHFQPRTVHSPDSPYSQTDITLILQGSLHDHTGVYYQGDLLLRPLHRKPYRRIADSRAGCLCLILSEERVRPTAYITALLHIFRRR